MDADEDSDQNFYLYPLRIQIHPFGPLKKAFAHMHIYAIISTKLSCAGLSLFTGNQLLCLLCIALASYQSLYPLMLLVPAALYFYMVGTFILVHVI